MAITCQYPSGGYYFRYGAWEPVRGKVCYGSDRLTNVGPQKTN